MGDWPDVKLPEPVKPGASLWIYYNEGNINNRKIHVRAIVDERQVVFRWWSPGRRRWVYKIEDVYYFYTLGKDGFLLEKSP